MKLACERHMLRELKNRGKNVFAFIRLKKDQTEGKRCWGFHCKVSPMWIIMSLAEGLSFEQKMDENLQQIRDANDENNVNIADSSEREHEQD